MKTPKKTIARYERWMCNPFFIEAHYSFVKDFHFLFITGHQFILIYLLVNIPDAAWQSFVNLWKDSLGRCEQWNQAQNYSVKYVELKGSTIVLKSCYNFFRKKNFLFYKNIFNTPLNTWKNVGGLPVLHRTSVPFYFYFNEQTNGASVQWKSYKKDIRV